MCRLSNCREKKRYVSVEIVLLTCLSITQYLGISALNLLVTVCIGMLFLAARDLNVTVQLLFTALPMFNLFNARIGSTSMYYLYIFIFWFRYFKFYHWRISRVKFLILLVFLAVRFTAGNITSMSKCFVLFSVLVLTFDEECFRGQLEDIVKYITISFLIASLVGYLMLIEGRSIYMRGLVYSDGVTTYRFAGLIGDAVFYSQFCALLVGANLTLGCYDRHRFLFSALASIGLTVFCLFSYAKTGLLLIAAEVICYVCWLIVQKSKKKSTVVYSMLIIVAAAGAVVGLVLYLLSGDIGAVAQNYLVRFSSGDLMTGRNEVWAHYLELLGDSWRTLFCAMPDSDYSALFTTNGRNRLNRAHNIYIESVCAFGLIITICILLWLVFLIIRSLKRKHGILNLMPIMVILGSGFSLHGHFDFHYYFIVALAIAFLTDYSFCSCESETNYE